MRFTAKRKNRFVTSSDMNSQILPPAPIVENQKFTRGCNRGCRPLLSIVVCPDLLPLFKDNKVEVKYKVKQISDSQAQKGACCLSEVKSSTKG